MKRKFLICAMLVVLVFNTVICSAMDNGYYIIENESWIDYKGFSEGLGGILDKDTQRWGFIDKLGAWVIEPQFKEVDQFHNGICSVTTADGEKIEIDRTGKRILDNDNQVLENISHHAPEIIVNMENCYYKEFYGKYYVLTKNGGTSALYDRYGNVIVPFGKWDEIAPASTSERMVVGINKRYGVADFSGNILMPLEFSKYGELIENDGKTARLVKGSKVLIDIATLNIKYTDSAVYYGGGRILLDNFDATKQTWKSEILDEQLNTIMLVDKPFFGSYISSDLEEGVYHMRENGNSPLKFLVFNDCGGIKVKLNGEKIAFDQNPIILNGRTLVPMRAIFEALGAEVEWDGDSRSVTATNGDVTIKMQIDNNIMSKNGQSLAMDVCPQLVDGRTMVPVRAISDSFEVAVEWNEYTRTVFLTQN